MGALAYKARTRAYAGALIAQSMTGEHGLKAFKARQTSIVSS